MPAFDPFQIAFADDPHPLLAALRERDPVFRFEPMDAWLLTRHADVVGVLRDPRFSANKGEWSFLHRQTDNLADHPFCLQIVKHSLLNIDPPDHTRIRELVKKAFTPRTVQRIEPRIRAVAAELLDAAAERHRMELVADFAYPLPVLVICDLLGLPAMDRTALRQWAGELRVLLDPGPAPEAVERAEKAAAEMQRYLATVFEERRARPRDDLLSALVSAEQQGDRLAPEELFAVVVLLVIAGHETTTNLLGNAVWSLLKFPEERRRLVADPSLLPTAVEEFLRHDGPVQLVGRVALEDLELAGRRIRKGEALGLMLSAANRDPAEFPDPDRLDVGRTPNHHVAFGHGAHFCLGAALARREVAVAFEGLLARFPDFGSDLEKPEWRSTLALRGIQRLPLEL